MNGHKPPSISTGQNMRESLWLEVVEFMTGLKLDQYIDVFQSEGYDSLESLNHLDMDDLRDMKVKKGHAKVLLHHIALIKSSSTSAGKRVQFKFRDTPSSVQSSDSANNTFVDTTMNISQISKHPSSKLNLAIVDETKHHSPQANEQPAIYSDHSSPRHLGQQFNNSGSSANLNLSGSIYHHTSIRSRGKSGGTPTINTISVPAKNTSRLNLNNVSSLRSEDSDAEYSHQTLHRVKSYNDHSPNLSLSDAGTVVIRHSVANEEDARSQYASSYYTHTPHRTAETNVLSPPPIMIDMHHDLSVLIEQLQQAKCANNVHYDEYHEALVNVTSNWDRNASEKKLKYMNSKCNYTNYVVLDLLGVLNAQLGQTEEAIKYHTDAIRASGNLYIEAMHNYAYLLHRIGDKESDLLSVKYYKMALNINESFAHCWLHFGNLLEDDGKLKEAVQMYKKAITIRSSNAAFHLDLANVLDDIGDFGEASEQYLKCVELQPNDPVYHWNYAISLENQCFYHKAEEAYKRAIGLDFNCVDAHLNYAHMLEIRPTPQYRKALKQYEIILKLPEMMHNTEIMLKCAKLYEHFGDNAKADAMYMRVLQLDPALEETYILFARHLTKQNRIEDANACYQAGIRHVQTPNLQNEYIKFLKGINNIYNNKKSQNGGTQNGVAAIHTTANPVTASRPRGASRNVPPSPFVTSMKSPDVDMDIDLGYDYYKPAKRESNIKEMNSNKHRIENGKAAAAVTAVVPVDDQGCIVM